MKLKKARLLILVAAIIVLVAAILIPRLTAPQTSDLVVINAWVRPVAVNTTSGDNAGGMEGMAMNDSVTGAYALIENRGGGADRLVSVSSEIATSIDLHETQVDASGIARMRPQPEGLVIPGNSTVEIRPGGYHLMLTGLQRSLELGQTVAFTFTFESGTTIDVSALVSDFAPED